MGEEEPLLGLSDSDGRTRVLLSSRAEGAALGFVDAGGLVRATFGVRENESTLGFYDAKGTLRAGLLVIKDNPLLFADRKGKKAWKAP